MTSEVDLADAWAELERLLPALLRSIEALGFIARYLHPPDFARVMDAAGTPDNPLRAARPALEASTGALEPAAKVLANAADETLGAFDELRAANDIRAVFRALRHTPRALEALYPLATLLPPVSRFFLDP